MRPEKTIKKDSVDAYTALGIPEDWVPVLQKAGYLRIEDLKDIVPGKLHQEICGLNKKNKLDLINPTLDQVSAWSKQIK